MTVINENFTVHTKGNTDIIDLTPQIRNVVYSHELQNAMIYVYAQGSTVSVTNIEFEPGLLVDFPEVMEKLVPSNQEYHHDSMWHDGNGYAHIRASIVGNSTYVPLIDGLIQLGQWQQIVLVDFDNKARARKINVQIIY
ncbi:MAG TPA: secondary thiamine-phosphate synthase enzyme [Cyanobacteria bacterium UBA11991]|nr:secondary thiamine-phosphate synthase enzyme YjbQ [Cyanobacteriota bacterium]MDY6359451.1 secondary thiamine-phosphate synthase enzyme YjbQ [Cyanobacteriota bacterium]MDY6363425.1 secondary thiamine-phosphate synthase enzyme YjbQ [Cyanobacteriota bacterium]MDY6382524.1 secondary thiamine-phosphate synthase enzyme YjbQ [Cyanobacteriota bacterium]HCB11470.1 secondary thiamine-phosphate synthase enzyme [Cyanobacteria bacterium UBA11991]